MAEQKQATGPEDIFIDPKEITSEQLAGLEAELGQEHFVQCENGLIAIKATATKKGIQDVLQKYGVQDFVSPFWATTQWGPDGVAKPGTYVESNMPFPDLKGKKENKEEEQ